ncbi:long-chain fatty acid transporter [Agrobacterium sp. a22-2]|uniref:OmpP1/FadL family transporter n=1 Tax=Agrobacterium sp. a22-2 TaxID=2283840 RepID=UPI001444B3F3|nr:outer membrane protein transport protein [Agrobacterium sp. a22-2]NKN36336.1 long-chain fatty acid transporter [Agrobacterium sp. a22-2]
MANTIIKTGLLSLLGACALVTSVQAGGFSRGEADTDILFEEGNVVVRGGVTYVNPGRTFDTVGGAASSDDAFSDDYVIPNFAAKFKLTDNLGCALTYTQPFGASSTYGPDAQLADQLAGIPDGSVNYYTGKEFITNEFGATCDVKFQAGPGDFHVLGGVFLEDFDYTARAYYGTLHLEDDSALGYRIGAAYDIKEYALRIQLMYRSAVDHEADGDFTPGFLDFLLGPDPVFADGYGTLPQSLKLSAQTGVAPGWLVYGSVKWTDWSVLQALNYNITGLGDQQDIYNWKDGWTLQAGVAHAFTEKVAGTINLTWDSGVGNGADIMTDTWTLATGASIKAGPGEFRVGGAVSYLTEGSQSYAEGATFDATADGDWAYALSASYKIAF